MKKLKKAFTLTELVIVIAVIAILAAVLIPTYTSLVRKANISADTQLAKNMNNLISDETTMGGVIDALAEGGYGIGKLNPTTEGHRFLWDQTSQQIIFVDENYKIVYKSKDINLDDAQLWLTVKKPSEVVKTKKFNLNYYLTQDSNQNFTLTTISNFDTGDNVLNGNLTINSTANGEAVISGTFNGTTTINTPNADIQQFGSMDELNVTAVANNSLEVNGYVNELNLTEGKVDMQTSAYVKKVTLKSNDATVVNAGIIETLKKDTNTTPTFTNNGGAVVTNEAGFANATTTGYTLQIGSLTELEGFRNAVNGGATFAGMTVELTADVELEDGWTPIGAFARDSEPETAVKSFQGTFDGNGHTISNLNNDGYSPKTAVLLNNPTTIHDKKEYSFGLFGYVSNAKFFDLTLTNVSINIETGSIYGDSVGALIGYSYGTLELEGITVGSASTTDASAISAYDGVAGVVGRAYGTGAISITDCVNYANITTNEKGAGILGYATNSSTITISGCVNYGNVTADGLALAHNTANASGIATIFVGGKNPTVAGFNNKLTVSSNANNGTIEVISTNTSASITKVAHEIVGTNVNWAGDTDSEKNGTVKIDGVTQ